MKLTPLFVALLVLSEKITAEEGDYLELHIGRMKLPEKWRHVVADFEKIIGRSL